MSSIISQLENCISYLYNNYLCLENKFKLLNIDFENSINKNVNTTNNFENSINKNVNENENKLPCEMNNEQLQIFDLSNRLHDLQIKYDKLYNYYIQNIYKKYNYYL